MFFWVYVLEGGKDKGRYIGFTHSLNKRLEEHKAGKSFATSFRRPFKLVYIEGSTNSEDARRRERYLKTTQGGRFLSLRLKEYVRNKKKAPEFE